MSLDEPLPDAEISRISDYIHSLNNDDTNKQYIVSILRILHSRGEVLNESSNGIYVNLTTIKNETMKEIQKYVNYIMSQEKLFSDRENERQTLSKMFAS